jgi:hypothetical protein
VQCVGKHVLCVLQRLFLSGSALHLAVRFSVSALSLVYTSHAFSPPAGDVDKERATPHLSRLRSNAHNVSSSPVDI